jgi:hypothetical protein
MIRRKLAALRDQILFFSRSIKEPKVPTNADGRVLIHLGPGEENDDRFINVDTRPFPHIHIISSVDVPGLFPDNYADLVYSCHILEHISHLKIPRLLSIWHQWLKEDGILRISVPDIDKIIAVYREHGSCESIMNPLMGGQGYEENFHKAIFNQPFLTQLLINAGFTNVEEWDPEKVEDYSFSDWADKKYVFEGKPYRISLNLQGIKGTRKNKAPN